MHLKMSSAKWRLFGLSLNDLMELLACLQVSYYKRSINRCYLWYDSAQYNNYNDKTSDRFAFTNDIPYLAHTGELWGVYREFYKETWPRYTESALYHKNIVFHDNFSDFRIPNCSSTTDSVLLCTMPWGVLPQDLAKSLSPESRTSSCWIVLNLVVDSEEMPRKHVS